MQSELDAQDFAEWLAYDRVEPFGPERADLRSAMIACTTYNAQGGKAKVDDFMLKFEEPKKDTPDHLDTMAHKLMVWSAAAGAQKKALNG